MKKIAFTADPALVRLMIESQAGTLTKALMEGAMNSIDAGAKNINIILDASQIVIEDDGRGFVTAEEIEQNFGIMGRPHAMDDQGLSTDARHGRFRIGRGQMFNFGVNDWYTNNFHLHVDFKSCKGNDIGFGYREEKRVLHKGCKAVIRLYEPAQPGMLRNLRRELADALKYADVAVTIDGELVSSDPAKMKWDFVTDDAYIKRAKDNSGVVVYNDGIYVETISHWNAGCSGVVVSRKQLKLNTARNQVLRTHSVWQRITAKLKDIVIAKTKREVIRNDSDARKACELYADGDLGEHEFAAVRALPDVTGFYWSLNMIRRQANVNSNNRRFTLDGEDHVTLAFDMAGSSTADNMIQSGRALVLDERVREWLGGRFSFVDALRGFATVVSMEALKAETGDTRYDIIDVRTLKSDERIMLTALESCNWYFNHHLQELLGGNPRAIKIGLSTDAEAWTDSRSYVALDINWLRPRLKGRTSDFLEIVHLLVHEYCHDTRSDTNHVHDPHFFLLFHDNMHRHGGALVSQLESAWMTSLKNFSRSKTRLKAMEDGVKWRAAQLANVTAMEEKCAEGVAAAAVRV